jgi:AcrR family transcriptional regulator
VSAVKHYVRLMTKGIMFSMPRLWSETVETHRREVRDAILDTTAALAVEHGLLSVTMSRIAEELGIGRATLYRYFPDVEAILQAWHEREAATHLESLATFLHGEGDATERLQTVLTHFAMMIFETRGGGSGLGALLYQSGHLSHAHEHLANRIGDLLTEAAKAGRVRSDIRAEELAAYCTNALSAAATLSSRQAVLRLVTVILDGLNPRS